MKTLTWLYFEVRKVLMFPIINMFLLSDVVGTCVSQRSVCSRHGPQADAIMNL